MAQHSRRLQRKIGRAMAATYGAPMSMDELMNDVILDAPAEDKMRRIREELDQLVAEGSVEYDSERGTYALR